LGSDFEVADAGTGPVRLRLNEVVTLRGPMGRRPAFLVHFQGPSSPVLAPVVHHIVHGEMGELDLFLGPIVSPAEGTTYEAVFA
jgi:hypothetical protein